MGVLNPYICRKTTEKMKNVLVIFMALAFCVSCQKDGELRTLDTTQPCDEGEGWGSIELIYNKGYQSDVYIDGEFAGTVQNTGFHTGKVFEGVAIGQPEIELRGKQSRRKY
jgi:hypothetical protein